MAHSPLHNFIKTVFSQGVQKMVRFLIMVLMVQQTGANTWGQIVIAMTWITYLVMLADFGDSILASVFQIGDRQSESELLQIAFWKHLTVGLTSILVFSLLFASSQNQLYLYMAAYSAVLGFKGFSPEWVFYRNDRSGTLNILQATRSIIQLCVLWFLRSELTAILFIFLEICGEALWAVMSIFAWPTSTPRRLALPRLGRVNYYARIAFPVFIMNFAIILHTSADLFILNYFTSSYTVGLYSSVYRVVSFYYLVGTALTIIFRTRAARFIQNGEHEKTTNLLKICLKILYLLSLFYLALSASILKPLLTKLFKLPEIQSLYLVETLGLYILAAFTSAIFVEYFVAAQRRKELLAIAVLGAGTNIALNFLLIPHFSTIGAAISTILAECAMLIWLFSRKQLVHRLGWSWKILFQILLSIIPMLLLYFLPLGVYLKLAIGLSLVFLLLVTRWISASDLHQLKAS